MNENGNKPIKSLREFCAAIDPQESSDSKIAPEYIKSLTEQYKLLVDSADKTSTRRQAANTLFIVANSALLTAASAILFKETPARDWRHILPWITWLAAGLGMCLAWRNQILSFRALNKVKFKLINDHFESLLPAAIFRWEWEELQHGNYTDLSHYESLLPLLFGTFHVGVVVLRFAV